MSQLNKILDELEQKPGARAEGNMFGTLTMGNQDIKFTANRVYVDVQHNGLRFFGSQINPLVPDKWQVLQVHLQPETLGSGSYMVGGSNVKDIKYGDTEFDVEYTADQGTVDFNRSTSLARIFGRVEARFDIEGQVAVMSCQYDIHGWGIK